MLDETRVLVGCKDPEMNERTYKDKYMWGIRANSVKSVVLHIWGWQSRREGHQAVLGWIPWFLYDGRICCI